MRLTPEERDRLKREIDLRTRRLRRIDVPGAEKVYCAGWTERLTPCTRKAREGSRFCGQHAKMPNAPRL